MSYSQNLSLGEIAYDGFHALSEAYPPFESLPKAEQERWAQAARNACDAWTGLGGLGVDVERWRTSTSTSTTAARRTP